MKTPFFAFFIVSSLTLLGFSLGCDQVGVAVENQVKSVESVEDDVRKFKFQVSDPDPLLVIEDFPGKINVIDGEEDEISVTLKGHSSLLEKISCAQDGNNVTLKGLISNSGDVTIINSNSGVIVNGKSTGSTININGKRYDEAKLKELGVDISKGISIQSSNDRVTINGVDVTNIDDKTATAVPSSATIEAIVRVPKNCKAEFDHIRKLISKASLSSIEVSCSGSDDAAISDCHSAELDSSGASKIAINSANGKIVADLSGSSKCTVHGVFSSARVETSGASSFISNGKVTKDFKADASGASSIFHSGEVVGRIKKDKSVSARITINQN